LDEADGVPGGVSASAFGREKRVRDMLNLILSGYDPGRVNTPAITQMSQSAAFDFFKWIVNISSCRFSPFRIQA
jgi:hypothetical protein